MSLASIRHDGILPTAAGPVRAPGLEQRTNNQAARVGQGLASGSLTGGEMEQLKAQRAHFQGSLTEAKADDGRVDPEERKALHQEMNAMSDAIFALKHNGDVQDRPAPPPAPGPQEPPVEGPQEPPQPGPQQPPAPGPEHGPGSPLGEKESFTATITGDPHFAVNGSIDGEEVSSTFDNQDLGTRTQYAGAGFKLDTTTVPWGDGGAAVVGSATVTTGFGPATKAVTVNADGSVLVNGSAVSLESGQTVQLNGTSSLTLNDDGTYTVSSRNGKVTNTFQANQNDTGNYLNITSSVDDVQTVGWLQQQV